MNIETLRGTLQIVAVPGQQSLTMLLCEYAVIQLWHDGIRQLYHAIKKRESGIVVTCDHLPEVFITENLSTVDVRRHRFYLSEARNDRLCIGYGRLVVVLAAKGESDLIKLLNTISLKAVVRDRDPSLDDVWYNW